jgi:glutaminyl-peptide cyclotransferase
MTALLRFSMLGALMLSTLSATPIARQAPAAQTNKKSAPLSTYKIVKTYPHDRQAFTQGLEYVNGVLYESTGQNGQSGIRRVNLETGEVLQRQPLDAKYFGEGITIWGDTLLQLTWQAEIGFVYDVKTFKQTKTFTYQGEGWGLTHDGTRVIMSDGSSALRFLDPKTLKETGRINVRDGATPIDRLNELEMVKGEVFANVWTTKRIVRISPKTGQVTGWLDLEGILDAREAAGADVLNGIAYDAAGDRLFVTGKWWPKLFEIKVVPR